MPNVKVVRCSVMMLLLLLLQQLGARRHVSRFTAVACPSPMLLLGRAVILPAPTTRSCRSLFCLQSYPHDNPLPRPSIRLLSVRPGNIFVMGGGQVALIDCGQVRKSFVCDLCLALAPLAHPWLLRFQGEGCIHHPQLFPPLPRIGGGGR